MRVGPVALVAMIVGAALLPLPSFASSGLLHPTIDGSAAVFAGRPWAFSGKLVAGDAGLDVPLGGVRVGLYLDGVRVEEVVTDASGYLARIRVPIGTHVLDARIYEGQPLEGRSDPLPVTSVPTYPAAMTSLAGHAGFLYTEANLTWGYPWTDGGYPVTSYHLDRSVDGGAFSPVFDGLATAFVDPDVLPGHTYRYRGTATTSWGTSNTTLLTYASEPTVTNVSITGFHLCDGAGCQEIEDGGVFETNATENVTVDTRLYGVADDHPIAAPGIAGLDVHGRVQLPNALRLFTRTSGPDGVWTATAAGLWQTAPVGGCETFRVEAYARTSDQGHMRAADGSFTLCVP